MTISLLPADLYTVINRTIITEIDKQNIITLYEPIIGSIPVSLYFTLIRDLDKLNVMSKDFTHHHLMTILKSNLEVIKVAREALEGVGLLKTYYKEGDINHYVYELYSPMTPKEFFSNPIFNVILYNNIGKKEYEMIKSEYEITKFDLKEYLDITKTMNTSFKSINGNFAIDNDNIRERLENKELVGDIIDFDLVLSSLPKSLVNEKIFTKKLKSLINELAFIYNIDSLKMIEILRLVISEGVIDREELRRQVRKYYQYENNGALPTLIYRTQPEYLKTPSGDDSNRGKMIFVFENTSPYDFLKSKYKGAKPTSRDLKILENLIVDLELTPAVVNVLIDYVLRSNNNKLTQAFVETIAGQWKRTGIKTANEAMEIAEREHNKYSKKNNIKPTKVQTPVWFDEKIEKEEVGDDELKELEDMLKDFR